MRTTAGTGRAVGGISVWISTAEWSGISIDPTIDSRMKSSSNVVWGEREQLSLGSLTAAHICHWNADLSRLKRRILPACPRPVVWSNGCAELGVNECRVQQLSSLESSVGYWVEKTLVLVFQRVFWCGSHREVTPASALWPVHCLANHASLLWR